GAPDGPGSIWLAGDPDRSRRVAVPWAGAQLDAGAGYRSTSACPAAAVTAAGAEFGAVRRAVVAVSLGADAGARAECVPRLFPAAADHDPGGSFSVRRAPVPLAA